MKCVFLERKLRTDKLGMLYLSAVLKEAGHDVDLVQIEVNDVYGACCYVKENKPDFVFFSVQTGEHLEALKQLTSLSLWKDLIKIVVGGPHFTYYPEDGLTNPLIDFVVQGPGENVIVDIVEGRITSKLVRGTIPDLDKFPVPDRSILYRYPEFGKARMKRFIICRDCKHACAYCFNHLYHKMYLEQKDRFFQRPTPGQMVAQILDVQQTYGLELVYFNDDDLCADPDWLKEFLVLYHTAVGLPFCGSVRADTATTELLTLMKEHGCAFLNIALESAIPSTQRLLHRTVNSDKVRRACIDCQRLGIKVRLQNMIGLPVENPLEDALDTLEFNLSCPGVTDSWAAIYQPFPQTALWRYCVDKGLLKEGRDAKNFYEDTVLTIPNAEKINNLHKWWYWVHKHRVREDMLHLLLGMPWTEEQKDLLQEKRWKEAAAVLYGM